MFNIGFTELIVLAVIGLLVLGPEQLPEVAKKLTRLINELKRAKDEILEPIDVLKNEAQNMLAKARENSVLEEQKRLIQETQEQINKSLAAHEGDKKEESQKND